MSNLTFVRYVVCTTQMLQPPPSATLYPQLCMWESSLVPRLMHHQTFWEFQIILCYLCVLCGVRYVYIAIHLIVQCLQWLLCARPEFCRVVCLPVTLRRNDSAKTRKEKIYEALILVISHVTKLYLTFLVQRSSCINSAVHEISTGVRKPGQHLPLDDTI